MTPTQQRMLSLLSDGKAHSAEELHACLEDELSALSNVRAHVSNTRSILRSAGLTIVCERGCYRLMRLASILDI